MPTYKVTIYVVCEQETEVEAATPVEAIKKAIEQPDEKWGAPFNPVLCEDQGSFYEELSCPLTRSEACNTGLEVGDECLIGLSNIELLK